MTGVEQGALLKVLAHAAKFPACGINGALLGSTSSAGGVDVTDVVPLCHTSLALAPAIEFGLAQVECFAQQAGLEVVGYYHSDARFAPASDLPPLARKVADRIVDRRPGGVALLLDNKKLETFCKQGINPFDTYSKDGAKGWKRDPAEALQLRGEWKALHEAFLAMFGTQRHRDLVDFEEHLDDVSKDYTNKAFEPAPKRFALPGNVL